MTAVDYGWAIHGEIGSLGVELPDSTLSFSEVREVYAALEEAYALAEARIIAMRRPPVKTIPCGAPDECERGY